MSAIFQILHVVPNPKLHIFHRYMKVIESVQWGLRQLGKDVSYASTQVRSDAVNIIFGAQMLDLPTLERLPRSTVVYNLKQMAGTDPRGLGVGIWYCAVHFRIWDFTRSTVRPGRP